MFDVARAINGAPVLFLVDTGATLVTLSAAPAKRLKLKYSKKRVITKGVHPSNPLLGNSLLSSVHVGQKDKYALLGEDKED
jgi:predicted aspartyl protease